MSGDLVVDGHTMANVSASLSQQPFRIPLTAVPALEGSCSGRVIDEMGGLAMYYRITAQLTIDEADRVARALATAAQSFTGADTEISVRTARGVQVI
ncbi:hypothetical protein [Schumannella sp. 10F1B-5-1]|uniref:hypothetical protein n=1 Tax=Schumannella sp. 10F1B-5-1 TaxID=2590780 RepID=UPI001130FD46|nr:hypothetical protein [Schumannella sp. 10F1B-5-1]TPW73515.1 hypothetical protein FJ658_04840 [Schumannella sp. 10F1B-5-1]